MSLVNLNANQIINQKYFQAVLECDLKAYLLKFEECNAVENEYSLILKENLNNQKSTYLKMLRLGEREVRQFSPSEFEKMTPLLVNASLNTKSLSAYCDSLHLVKDRKSGVDYYQASLLIPRAKLTRNDKKVLAYIAFVLSKLTKYVPPKGVLVDSKLKCHKVSTDKLYGEVEKKVDYLIELFMRKEPPELHLNSHCQYCCFQERCFNLAKGSDHLSLLSGISSKEIRRLNKRGIFTVTQYSYVYRYRKRNSDSIGIKYSTSLKALACRTQKTYIVDKPKLPNKHVQIYFDVESVPERNFFYLIGTVVVTDESKASYSFWADSEHDEYSIFLKFLDLVSEYEDYNIIHYGDYEKKYVLHMERKYSFNSCQMVILSKIKQRLLNALSLIYGYVYFPTYGNSLKEIAREIGFNWSSNLSGHKSISLRYQWESSKSKKAMEKLRKYNVEDCLALYEVINFIENSICIEEACDEQVVPAKSLNKKATFKFGNSEYLIKELEYFNKCSYFEYQRDKVFVRKPSKKRKSRVKKRKHKNVRVSTVIDIPYLRVCNRCHCSNVYRHGKLEKVVFDLKFTNFGVSRYIIKYRSDRARCGSCKSVFTSPDYLSIKSKYGSSLQIWVVYQMIALGLTYGKIVEELWSVFGYQVSRQFCYAIKRSMALHYEPTRKQIINNLNKSNAIYADETSINLQGIKGYVWVFVSQTEVLYIFAPTREKKLLDEVLTEFNGVLVSDFYAAYDSYKGPQQKCLIHLVRDMNDDLRAHPFDVDYKSLITELSKLLYEIVSKVDKYGLRKRFLHKYLNKADNFMNKVSCYEGSSEATNKYKNRFTKYKDKLFTFLDYDDVTWNNNYAEHAIKVFAQYRRVADGSFTKNGIEKYLALLSISETCKLRGIDFLDFLKSRKLNLHETSYSSNQKRNT